jgi:hypothetical protein
MKTKVLFQISGTTVIHDEAYVYHCPRLGEFIRLNDVSYKVVDLYHDIAKCETIVFIKTN